MPAMLFAIRPDGIAPKGRSYIDRLPAGAFDPAFVAQMEAAREIMESRRAVLRELAT